MDANMTNGNIAERERFDSAMQGEPFYWHRNLWTTENGEYRELIAQAAWFAWQARAALSVCADRGNGEEVACDEAYFKKWESELPPIDGAAWDRAAPRADAEKEGD